MKIYRKKLQHLRFASATRMTLIVTSHGYYPYNRNLFLLKSNTILFHLLPTVTEMSFFDAKLCLTLQKYKDLLFLSLIFFLERILWPNVVVIVVNSLSNADFFRTLIFNTKYLKII